MSDKHLVNLESQVKQARLVKKLTAENSRLRAQIEILQQVHSLWICPKCYRVAGGHGCVCRERELEAQVEKLTNKKVK